VGWSRSSKQPGGLRLIYKERICSTRGKLPATFFVLLNIMNGADWFAAGGSTPAAATRHRCQIRRGPRSCRAERIPGESDSRFKVTSCGIRIVGTDAAARSACLCSDSICSCCVKLRSADRLRCRDSWQVRDPAQTIIQHRGHLVPQTQVDCQIRTQFPVIIDVSCY